MKEACLYICTTTEWPNGDDLQKAYSSLPQLLKNQIDRYKIKSDWNRSLLGKLMLRKVLFEKGRANNFNGIQCDEFGKYSCSSEFDFNISHTDEAVVLAFAEGLKVGVDIEQNTKGSLVLAERFFAEDEVAWLHKQSNLEAAFVHLWTRKEALAKCYGTGIRMPLKSFSVLNEVVDYADSKWYLQSFPQKKSNCILSLASSEKVSVSLHETPLLSVL